MQRSSEMWTRLKNPDTQQAAIDELGADYEKLKSVEAVAYHQGYSTHTLFLWLQKTPALQARFDEVKQRLGLVRQGRARTSVRREVART